MTTRPFFGWYVVAGAFAIATFGWGFGFYGIAVYVAELQVLRGWPVSLLGSAATAYYLFGALLLGFYDSATARFGQRTVTFCGIVAMAGSVLALGMVRAPWQLFAAVLVMAVGWSTMSLTAVTAIIAPWFERRRGLAVSLALNGASCGGIVLAPALIGLTEMWGLEMALRFGVGIMLLVLLPIAAFCVGRSPAELGQAPDGRLPATRPAPTEGPVKAGGRRQLVVSHRFWMAALPFALGLLAQVGFLTHQVAFLSPRLGTGGAATALALTTAMAVLGRVTLGLVVDRWNPRWTTAGCLTSQALALLVMASWPTPPALYAGCVVFGFSVGNLITLPAVVAQHEFPPEAFVTVVGLIAAVSQVFYAFGPGVVGVVAEATGGYTLPLVLCIVLEVAAAVLLLIRPRQAQQ